MKEALRQSLTQKLQQRLSPLQMRFVRMLEMTGPEMEEEVRRELDDNPALEVADRMAEGDTGGEDFHETAEQMQLADYRDEDDIPSYRLEARNHSADDRYYEPVAVAGDGSLIDCLMGQLSETDLSDRELDVARYIAGNLDDNGYMTRSLTDIQDDLAFNAGIDADDREIRRIYEMIRTLDPAGVGANDLRDCLVLQLRRMPSGKNRDNALEIVSHYFDLFSNRHFDRLMSAMGISREELRDAEDVIRNLDPKPASRIGESEADDRTRHIIPDFTVEADQNGNLTVAMPGNIPDLIIESSFAAGEDEPPSVADQTSRRSEALSFISRKREEATGFIELVRMRQITLMRVMEAIVRLQRDFFITEDETRLHPMILKDVAALTGYDISVVSRATAGKYVATAGGVYPLKFFFNEKVSDEGNSSSHEILAAIKEIISGENPASPLSDDAIMASLHDRGYDIARRTVAKYREKLGIPVARLRKKL